MKLSENVLLSSLTTFKIGGTASYVVECETIEDIQMALAYARERHLPWYVLSGGSNLLSIDEGYVGVLIRPLLQEISFTRAVGTANACIVKMGSGVVWDVLVQECAERGLWGLENLAGIPGLVGGAPVQNIGAYGADVSDTLTSVEAYDTTTDQVVILTKEECELGYRDSRFKRDQRYVITSATFLLSRIPAPRINYSDLNALVQNGAVLTTPTAIAEAVRTIRARKFPDITIFGTAGSFFKNPFISKEKYAELVKTYPELPGFPVENSTDIKIPLAWILDHVLNLRGYAKGPVRCFEQQPLVLVSQIGATAKDVEVLARDVEKKVFDATGISIEREVRALLAK